MAEPSLTRPRSPLRSSGQGLVDEASIPGRKIVDSLAVTPGATVLVKPKNFAYELVEGFFFQDGPLEGPPLNFEADVLSRSFGLVDQSAERWQNLRMAVAQLQDAAVGGVQYKVFFLARHGEGWHNVGSTVHGREAWLKKWAFTNGDGTITWGPDPALTPLGIEQAKLLHRAWVKEAAAGAPVGSDEMKWYCSPMVRTGQTLLHTWGDLLAGRPEVWEDWRELLGEHTCNQRNPRSIFEAQFPDFDVEPDMSEEDVHWKPDECESKTEMQERMLRAMDRVFGPRGTDKTFVSVTMHSAVLMHLLAVLGHCPYRLSPGEVIPVVVRATPVVYG